MGMLTSGAERSRRFGGSSTRAIQMLLCSDVACGRAAYRCQDTCPSAARPPPRTLPDHLPAISRRTWMVELVAFLFKRKEEPSHTKNKTNNQQTGIQGRFACSLCFVVASMCCCGHGDPAPCTVAQLLPRPVTRFGITSPS